MPKKIRVMHCLSAIFDGGQETFLFKTFKFIKGNSSNDYDFTICGLVHYTNSKLIKKYNQEGIKFYSLNFIDRKKSFKDVIHNCLEIFRLARLVKKERIDILYGHDFFSAMIVRMTRIVSAVFFFYKIKKVYISIHIPLIRLKKPQRLLNKLLSYFTDRIICVSNSVFSYSLQTDKIKRSKYLVIYNGIDVDEFSLLNCDRNQSRLELGINWNTIVIGSVGNFALRKGQLYLVKAFNEVLKRAPNSLLVIFGSCRGIDSEFEYKESVDKLIKEFGIGDRIRTYSPRLDINKAYSAFDIFVMPSLNEGFGLVLAEAMSMECIVIASDIPPFKEIISDGYDGFIFKAGNYTDLAGKIVNVLNMDKTQLRQISANARSKVLKKFNSEIMGKQYAKLYDIY